MKKSNKKLIEVSPLSSEEILDYLFLRCGTMYKGDYVKIEADLNLCLTFPEAIRFFINRINVED